MAELWFNVDRGSVIPDVSDIYNTARLAYVQEVARKLNLALAFSSISGSTGKQQYFVKCEDTDVNSVLRTFGSRGVLPNRISFDDQETTIELAMEQTTLYLDYSLPDKE